MINKLVPGLLDSENKRMNEFYANRGLSVPQNGNSSRPITPNSQGNSLNCSIYNFLCLFYLTKHRKLFGIQKTSKRRKNSDNIIFSSSCQ